MATILDALRTESVSCAPGSLLHHSRVARLLRLLGDATKVCRMFVVWMEWVNFLWRGPRLFTQGR